ncbi:MAG TPA: hypothetical protein VKO43_07095 [Candidatus Krumholzibacteriaceae bacterium]|nr:hypothetical protein [Candidatus Krumholzibacteriaceae bacterium]
MRLPLKQSVLILAVAVLAASVSGTASASESFNNWASSVSNRLDRQWNNISRSSALSPVSFKRAPGTFRRNSSQKGFARRYHGGRSNWTFVNSGFTRRGNTGFLTSTAKRRRAPSRGTASFDHPARGRHGSRNGRFHHSTSQNYRRKHVSSRGGISRPRLTNFTRSVNTKGSRTRRR